MNRRTLGCVSLVLLAALLAHGQIVSNGFTNWDDPHTIAENPRLNPPNIGNTLYYWGHFAAGLYVPVTYTAWSALAAISRSGGGGTLVAWPFHVASLIAHGAAATFVFLILRRLLDGRDAPACIGAMLFAVHPLQVEAVAWTSGLKDVLAGAFALAAVHQHIVSTSSGGRRTSLTAIGCFLLAMLSKPSAVVILPMIATIDLLLLRRSFREVATSLLPWVLVTVPILIVARIVQETGGIPTLPMWKRLLVAGHALMFYLRSLFVPVDLGFDYGRSPEFIFASGEARTAWILPAVVAVMIAVSRSRWLAAAGLLFVSGLAMNLGLAPFQFQFYSTVADHYVYLAMLGPALAAAWVMARPAPARGAAAVTIYACAGIIVATLVGLSFRQAGFWKDSVTLFTHAVQVNPDSAGAHNNLGRTLAERGGPGDLEAAQREFLRVLQIAPYDPSARRNLALVALKYGDLDAGIANLTRSIELNERAGAPVPASDYRELAKLLIHQRRTIEATGYIQRGLAVDPDDAQLRQMRDDLNP
jgi:tetratricopeptide (TPR) repeat protein